MDHPKGKQDATSRREAWLSYKPKQVGMSSAEYKKRCSRNEFREHPSNNTKRFSLSYLGLCATLGRDLG